MCIRDSWNAIITEVYYPTVDRPQLRDLQYLITDGKSFFHDEKRHLKHKCERLSDHGLGYRCTNSDPDGRYAIVKEIITDPHIACVLQRTKLTGDESFISKLQLYALCAPHLEVGGRGNNGYVAELNGRTILMAHKEGTWLALAATVPFARVSCGYVGRSDGWTDLAGNFQMDWEFDHATDGNIALTGQLDLRAHHEFTLGLAFGDTQHHAITTLFQALGIPFEEHHKRYKAVSYTHLDVYKRQLLSMLCWGSWANTQKIDKRWRFELFYWDYMWGLLACALVFGLTLGSRNLAAPDSFFRNLSAAGPRSLVEAFCGGVIFNLGNLLLVAAISVAGMALSLIHI